MRIGILILFNLLLSSIFAQKTADGSIDYSNKYSVIAQYGISKPMGFFNSTDIEESQAAFAKAGHQISLSFLRRFNSQSYLSLNLNTSSYQIDLDTYLEYVIPLVDPTVQVFLESEGYRVNSLTFGYHQTLGRNKVKYFIQPYLGIAQMKFGTFRLELRDSQEVLENVIEENFSEVTLLYGFNSGVYISLGKSVDLLISAGISSAAFDLSGDYSIQSKDNIENGVSKGVQPYTVFNIGSGLVFHF